MSAISASVPFSHFLTNICLNMMRFGAPSYHPETAELFLMSAIDSALNGTFDQFSPSERADMIEALERNIPNDPGFSRFSNHLRAYVKEKKRFPGDISTFSDNVNKAIRRAKRKNETELTVAALIDVIFDYPDAYLLSYFSEPFPYNTESTKENITEETPKETASKTEETLEKQPVGMEEDHGSDTASDKAEESGAAENEKKEDPKNSLAELTEKAKRLYDQLRESVRGQDNAIGVFTAGYFQAELQAMTDQNRKGPRAIFLFAGPPGVGKTFLAETIAEALDLPFHRFDMSDYSFREASIEFSGSDKVYRNGKEGNVTSFVARNPKSVLLFDELEKAHITIIHLFLQILDAGHIHDCFTDKEVSFTDTIIFFTTNAGKQLYENSDRTDFSDVSRKVILNALKKDINPETQEPYFPSAICSRFASGNVVMFNYIAAHNLRNIAKKEVLRHAANFESKIGIQVQIDEPVYTALLFSEGGNADARMIKGRADSFFNTELFELFRLLDSDSGHERMGKLDSIHIKVDLPRNDPKTLTLFENENASEVLVFASQKTYGLIKEGNPGITFLHAQNIEKAARLFHRHDVDFVLLDMSFGKAKTEKYLNIEDLDSKARDFFWFLRETHPDIPLYLIQTEERKLNDEERLSFLRQGVRDVVILTENTEQFAGAVHALEEQLHQQKSMTMLAKANKLVTFETAQSLANKGKTAEITLFDFEMITAIDAEDAENILSNVSKPDVKFDQIIGAEDAKRELKYFVEYLKNPKKYLGTGVSAPKGVLLYGPPGTGKTMLAKAMANASDMTFIAAEGNQFINQYQGVGRDRVKELFRTARKYAPSIIFIDEIDAIAKERTGGEDTVDIEATLTAFFTEMDGFKTDTARPVFVLAATNFDVEPGSGKSLDQAFMRRFDRRVYIGLPTRDERVRYIRMKTAENKAFQLTDGKIDNIAVRSTGMSLAQLESVMELSLRSAIRDGNLKVTDAIFDEAFETFNGGEIKNWDNAQLERVARHEAGHAFLSWQSGGKPSYLTIVARGDHGGYMQDDDCEGKAIYTKDELLAKVRTALGGRAAELVYYGERDGMSTGAKGDLESATQMARQIIGSFGMDERFGLAVADSEGALSPDVRKAVNQILEQEMKTAVRLIGENRELIDALVKKLLSENHLTGSQITEVFKTYLRKRHGSLKLEE